MPVHPVEDHAGPVDLEQAVLDAEPAHTHPHGDVLGQAARRVVHVEREVVQVRVVRAPQPWALDAEQEVAVAVARHGTGDPGVHAALAGQDDAHAHRRLGEVVGDVGHHAEVLDVHGGPAVQDDVPEQAREPEEVLVLDPRPGAPPDHLRHDDVLAVDHGVGEVELRRGERVRPVAHVGAVQPQGDGALRAVEADAQPLAGLERVLEGERPAVRRHGVVPLGHLPRLELLVPVPRVLHVGVLRAVVAEQLHVGGDRHVVPARVVDVHALEAGDDEGGALRVVQLPQPVERLLEGARPGRRLLRGGEPPVVGVRVEPVLLDELRVGDPVEVEGHLMAPVTPSAKLRCSRRNTTTVGTDTMNTASMRLP